MAMVPVYNPPVGDVMAPINGMLIGKSLYIFGKVSEDADEFRVTLICGDDQSSSDIALQLNPRFEDKHVARNTRTHGIWYKEERAVDFPFKKGDYFSFKITCTKRDFVIAANDAVFTTYGRRLSFFSITHVAINHQCQTVLITSQIDGAKEHTFPIPLYNLAGRKIVIAGIPTKLDALGSFVIELITDNDEKKIFYCKPRWNEKRIVRNTLINGAWGREERILGMGFPFRNMIPFVTTISISNDQFVVDINNAPASTYNNRVKDGIRQIRYLRMWNNLILESITFVLT